MRVVTVIGGNLFELAAEYLGDALQWVTLALLNNMSDPMLSGQNEIRIPDSPSAPTDGIGPQ